jgi:cellulose biosynthesis protein BcsQ
VCFAKAGYRTLAIDLDQQGNLSAGLGVDLNELTLTAHRLLVNEVPEIQRYLSKFVLNSNFFPTPLTLKPTTFWKPRRSIESCSCVDS